MFSRRQQQFVKLADESNVCFPPKADIHGARGNCRCLESSRPSNDETTRSGLRNPINCMDFSRKATTATKWG